MQELIHNLGKKIQYFRKKNNITLKKLADLIHATPSLISQIERGKANPSLSTLKAVADVLKIPIGLLFENESRSATSPIIEKNAFRKIITEGNVHYSLLNPGDNKMEVLLIEFPPGASTGEFMYKHEGHECGYLMSGELTVYIEDEVFVMHPGDSINYESSKPHKLINEGEQTATVVWVNIIPWIFVHE